MYKKLLIVVFVVGFSFMGCKGTVGQEDIRGASELCKDHEGIYKFTVVPPYGPFVYCKDGSWFDIDDSGRNGYE